MRARWSALHVLRLSVLVAIVVLVADHPPRSRSAAQSPGPSRLERPVAELHAVVTRLPVRFEANSGQYDDPVRFVARRASGATAFLTDDGMTLVIGGAKAAIATSAITMRLVGAAKTVPAGEDELITKSNYFLGNDPARWRTGVANFGRVRVHGALPGVDMVWHGGEDGLEYDLEVAAGLDATRIELEVDGASRLVVDDDGTLRLETPEGTLHQKAPRVVQAGRPLHARVRVTGAHRIVFDIEGYDPTRPVLIDPVLAYSTYLGGTGIDEASGVAVDAAGNAYVVGTTESADFPTANARQGAYPGGSPDSFVAKLDASGSALLYSTYLGGAAGQNGLVTEIHGVAVDAAGNAYVTGETSEHDFPTVNAAQSTYVQGSTSAAFVAKLSASGSSLVYSTFLGGNTRDEGYAIAVDSAGSAYVTGDTVSTNFPTVNAVQSFYRGMSSGAVNGDAFVTKLSPSGAAFVYSTYLGGTSSDSGTAIAVDGAGHAYVTGDTSSTDFPTANAMQGATGGQLDVFVVRLSPSGSTLDYSTYLGGSANDFASGVAVDPAGNAFIGGYTLSGDFPTVHSLKAWGDAGSSSDAFVAKLNPTGSALVYSTYLGGSGLDEAMGIAVDPAGAVTLAGITSSADFPTVNPVQATLSAMTGSFNAFVASLDPAGSALVYATYLGGSFNDEATGIALDSAGGVYLTGFATSVDFPTKDAFQPIIGNAKQCCLPDAFLAKIAGPPPGPPDSDAGPPPSLSDQHAATGAGSDDAGTSVDASASDAAGPIAADAEASPDGGTGPAPLVAGCACDVRGQGRVPAPGIAGVLGLIGLVARRRTRSSPRPRSASGS